MFYGNNIGQITVENLSIQLISIVLGFIHLRLKDQTLAERFYNSSLLLKENKMGYIKNLKHPRFKFSAFHSLCLTEHFICTFYPFKCTTVFCIKGSNKTTLFKKKNCCVLGDLEE